MRAGLGVSEGDFGDALGRRLSIQSWLVGMNGVRKRGHYSAVAMRCVLAEADITRQEELREQLCELLQGENDGRVISVGNSTKLVLTSAVEAILLTFFIFMGTPNRITLLKPLLTSGPRNPSSLLTPHRF